MASRTSNPRDPITLCESKALGVPNDAIASLCTSCVSIGDLVDLTNAVLSGDLLDVLKQSYGIASQFISVDLETIKELLGTQTESADQQAALAKAICYDTAMAKVFDTITDDVRAFIAEQKMFFVATAPRQDDGHINLSPKGLDETCAVLDKTTFAYLDLTGSGVETIAHVKENGRICIMFCAFEGRPRIVRIHGTGDVVLPEYADFAALRARFGRYDGVRSIIRVRATRVSDSCGYGVPLYEHKGTRDQLLRWVESKGEDGVAEYQRDNNAESLDGLPGV